MGVGGGGGRIYGGGGGAEVAIFIVSCNIKQVCGIC